MRTIETQVYTFDELSDDVKEKVIEEFRDDECKHLDLYSFAEDCNEYLKEKGFTNASVKYSLGYSQGDGLSFEADEYSKLEDLYIEELGKGKEKTAKLLADNSTFICTGNKGGYGYASTSDIDLFIEYYTSEINTDGNNISDVVDIVRGQLEDIYTDLCGELETRGYNEIEYRLSDECIIENIQCNDYEFTKEGKLI